MVSSLRPDPKLFREGTMSEEALPQVGDLPALTDAEVLATADAMMPEPEDSRMSELLRLQGAGRLTAADRSELGALMEMYKRGQLRKALAMVEAVKRGLRPRLGP
jgi:hypothetical protein